MKLGAGYRRHMCRCNRRQCQARRTLPKAPWLYKKWPECPDNCGGTLYVDWYRTNRGKKDREPLCRDYPHKVNSKNCKRREDYELERAAKPRSKHSPHKSEDIEAPF